MEQIRLAWRPDVVHLADVVKFSDEWTAATYETTKTLEIVLKAALAVYGPGSHWIERRTATDPFAKPP